MIRFEPDAAVRRRFCGRCQQWQESGIALHHCVKVPVRRRYEWQCPDCKAWYEPDASLPGHGHVCTKPARLRPVHKRTAEPLSTPPVNTSTPVDIKALASAVLSTPVDKSKDAVDRKTYQREWLRRKRAETKPDPLTES